MSRSDYKNIYEGYLDNTGYKGGVRYRERYGGCGSEPMPYEMNEKPVMENYNWWKLLTQPGALNTGNLLQQSTASRPTASQPTASASRPTASKPTATPIPTKNICGVDAGNNARTYSNIGGIITGDGITEDPDTRQVCKFSDSKPCWGFDKRYCKLSGTGWGCGNAQDMHLCNDKKIYSNTDQDGQTILQVETDTIQKCYDKLNTYTTGKGIVFYKDAGMGILKGQCYIISGNPSPYHREGSVLIMKNN